MKIKVAKSKKYWKRLAEQQGRVIKTQRDQIDDLIRERDDACATLKAQRVRAAELAEAAHARFQEVVRQRSEALVLAEVAEIAAAQLELTAEERDELARAKASLLREDADKHVAPGCVCAPAKSCNVCLALVILTAGSDPDPRSAGPGGGQVLPAPAGPCPTCEGGRYKGEHATCPGSIPAPDGWVRCACPCHKSAPELDDELLARARQALGEVP